MLWQGHGQTGWDFLCCGACCSHIPVILRHVHALRKHLKWCARALHLPVLVPVRSDFVATIMTSPRSHPRFQTITQRWLLLSIFVSNMTMQNQVGRTRCYLDGYPLLEQHLHVLYEGKIIKSMLPYPSPHNIFWTRYVQIRSWRSYSYLT